MTSREQLVFTRDDGFSPALGTNTGVPQGSVLGPLLYCLFADSLIEELHNSGVKISCYADDLTVYVSVKPDKLGEGVAALEKAAKIVSDWADRMNMKLNAEKTVACIFGSDATIKTVHSGIMPTINFENGISIPFPTRSRSSELHLTPNSLGAHILIV